VPRDTLLDSILLSIGAMRASIRLFILTTAVPLTAIAAQQPTRLSRAEAIAAATERGPRIALARADTALAGAQLLSARAIPNPTLSAGYTKDIPRYHVTAELPFDFLSLRGTRIASAEAARQAARYRFSFDRELLALDADTTYTRALAAQARLSLSLRNAQDADSLRVMAVARRAAGDASDLDVELATVFAGQQANLLAADSIALVSSLLDLQTVMGMPFDHVAIELSDTLAAPPTAGAVSPTDSTLIVAGAVAALRAADLALRLEHRSVFGMPGLLIGFDTGDPTGETKGLLPTIGISIPFPIFNRNRGPIAVAQAERERATAELSLTQVESRSAIARATRERNGALARLARDAMLVTSANRVASMSLAAYREGAVPLASVLEAQRNARDVLGQSIDDTASALVATATLRALTRTVTPERQP
jgi:cobalt-zinc-cadmium efflux system outer membrane protein